MNQTKTTSTPSCSAGGIYFPTTMSCSQPSLLRNALHLNNQGSVLIADGEYDEAVSTLSAALVQLKQAIRIRAPAPPTTSNSDGDSDGDDGSAPMMCEDDETASQRGALLRFLNDEEDNSPSALLEQHESEWYLYPNAVHVNEDAVLLTPHTSTTIDTATIIELISFASIYNLGLCHHLQALAPTLEGSKQVRLQRAAAFYEHAQNLLATNEEVFDPDLAHSLTITNNLGHAHYFMGNETTGKMCFQHLLNAIMYISDNNNKSGGSSTLTTSDKNRWDGFMVNIMQHLIGKVSHAAAA